LLFVTGRSFAFLAVAACPGLLSNRASPREIPKFPPARIGFMRSRATSRSARRCSFRRAPDRLAAHKVSRIAASSRFVRLGNFQGEWITMVRVSRRSWTPEQIELLLALVDKGVSPARASVILKRPQLAVQNKARQLGRSFPGVRDVRAARRARELEQVESVKRHNAAVGHSEDTESAQGR